MKTKNGMLNFLSVYVFYFIIAILSFIKLRFFLDYLGESIYSLNQLYTSIFSYLSLLEGGMGTALIYRLYKLLKEKKYDEINRLYSGTVFIYRIIGVILISLGIILSFFLPIFIKDNPFSLIFLIITFILYILKSCYDYFVFIPRYIIAADNQSYKINLIIYGFKTIEIIVEIILIRLRFNYIIVLIPAIIFAIIQNIWVNRKIYKLYPWLKYTKEKNMEVKKDIKSLMAHRISGLVFNNTDILILSSLVGSQAVVVYSGYNYIIKYIVDTVIQFFQAIRDGIGQIINENDRKLKEKTVQQTNTIFSFFAVVCVITLYFVLNDFVGLWLGAEYSATYVLLILFLLILYHKITNRSHLLYLHTLGLFAETKKYVYLMAFINIIGSLVLVYFIGIAGVVLATVISMYFIESWCYAYEAGKKIFNKFDAKLWLSFHIKNVIIIILGILLISLIPFVNITSPNWINWIIKSITVGICALVWALLTFNMFFKEMLYLEKRVINTVKKLFKHKA